MVTARGTLVSRPAKGALYSEHDWHGHSRQNTRRAFFVLLCRVNPLHSRSEAFMPAPTLENSGHG